MCKESVASISRSLKRASKIFQERPDKMVEIKKAAMAAAAEFTWSNAALQFEAMFEKLGAKGMLAGAGATVIWRQTSKFAT